MRRVLLLLLGFAVALPAAAQFTLSDEPFVGRAVTVTLPPDAVAADTLVVTYRPNSSIARRVLLPTGGAAAVTWTPDRAGVVALAVPGGVAQNVSVRFQRLPASGLFVLFSAALILFGGAVFSFRKLFEQDAPKTNPTRRPDT